MFIEGEVARGIEEGEKCECKTVTHNKVVDKIVEDSDNYAVGFLNNCGGTIYWGIKNNTGIVEGVRLQGSEPDDVQRRILAKLLTVQPRGIPHHQYSLKLHPVHDAQGAVVPERYVVELWVQAGSQLEVYATSGNSVYYKAASSLQKYDWEQATRFIRERQALGSDISVRASLQADCNAAISSREFDGEGVALLGLIRPIVLRPGLLDRVLRPGEENAQLTAYKSAAAKISPYTADDFLVGDRGWMIHGTGWRTWHRGSQPIQSSWGRWCTLKDTGEAHLFYNRIAQPPDELGSPGAVPHLAYLRVDLMVAQLIEVLAIPAYLYRDAGYDRELVFVGCETWGLQGKNIVVHSSGGPVPFPDEYSAQRILQANELAADPVGAAKGLARKLVSTVTRGKLVL